MNKLQRTVQVKISKKNLERLEDALAYMIREIKKSVVPQHLKETKALMPRLSAAAPKPWEKAKRVLIKLRNTRKLMDAEGAADGDEYGCMLTLPEMRLISKVAERAVRQKKRTMEQLSAKVTITPDERDNSLANVERYIEDFRQMEKALARGMREFIKNEYNDYQ